MYRKIISQYFKFGNMKTWDKIVATLQIHDKDTIRSSKLSQLMSFGWRTMVVSEQERLQTNSDATCMSVSPHVFPV